MKVINQCGGFKLFCCDECGKAFPETLVHDALEYCNDTHLAKCKNAGACASRQLEFAKELLKEQEGANKELNEAYYIARKEIDKWRTEAEKNKHEQLEVKPQDLRYNVEYYSTK